jgi:hypothetical protein
MSAQTKEKVITERAEIYCERRGNGPLLLLITGAEGDAGFILQPPIFLPMNLRWCPMTDAATHAVPEIEAPI